MVAIGWLAVKLFFKKTWSKIKKYWKYLIAIMYGIGVFIYFRDSRQKAEELIATAKESHKKQMDVINKSHKEELAKRDEIIKKYNDIVSQLETKYESNKETLEEEKKK